MTKEEFFQTRFKGIEFVQPKKCAQCTESCCQKGSCMLLPMDIDPFSVENVIEKIDTGKFSITATVLKDKRIQLRLHSREIDSEVLDINKPHTQCSLLTPTGCSLSIEERPSYALTLIPGDSGSGSCKQAMYPSEVSKMWDEVQDTMETVLVHYSGGKNSRQVVIESFDKVANDIYQNLLYGSPFKNYSHIVTNSILFGENLYDKIMILSKSAGTTARVLLQLVSLESNRKDYNGNDLAQYLLHFGTYDRLKIPIVASITEKFEACLEYNRIYLNM